MRGGDRMPREGTEISGPGGRDGAGRDAADEVWALAGLATPMALRVAATLRLADHVAAGDGTPAAVAAATGTDPGTLARLMRFLAARGVLAARPGGGYALTARGEALREDHPRALRGWLDIDGAGRPELAFVELLHSVRTGEAAFPARYGRTLWEDLAADPARAESFHGLVGDVVWHRSKELAAGYPWGRLGHVVDVGGGAGGLLIALLQAHPDLRGTLVDRPGTAEAARAAFAEAGLSDRAGVAAGTFFDPLPAGAGGYLLSLVLHNWPDRDALAILRRCRQAAAGGGAVLVVEIAGPHDDAPPAGMDLRMLAYCGGRERTVAQLAELGQQAGLSWAGVRFAGGLAIVELTAP
jgi:hypothetical protein